MKNTGYILALCLTASGHVLAHDVWITGKQAENNITAEIGYGHNFPSKGTIPARFNGMILGLWNLIQIFVAYCNENPNWVSNVRSLWGDRFK